LFLTLSLKSMATKEPRSHYYKNNFARHCPNINEDGHKMQPSPKIRENFWRRLFYLW
jgi:hypothetical protein